LRDILFVDALQWVRRAERKQKPAAINGDEPSRDPNQEYHAAGGN
jgi:hypothetical protein